MESYSETQIIKILKEKDISLFTLVDFGRIFKIQNQNTLYKKVSKLKKQGIVEQIIKGKYLFTLNQPDEFAIANFTYSPSYVSCESALSFYGIITGFPYQITSVSVKKSKKISFKDKEFSYSRLANHLYWGYEKKENFLIAEKEKALLDYFYFATKGWRSMDLDELDLSGINKNRLISLAKKFKNKKLLKTVQNLTNDY